MSGVDEAAADSWRIRRSPGWYHDIGYVLQDILRGHRYAYERKGGRPGDPGWHECTCGWEGYWAGFQPHVADHLRAALTPATPTDHQSQPAGGGSEEA